MAYKYFTERVLLSNLIDLNSVFPQKQQLAQENANVSYGIADVAIFLKEKTDDFKKVEQRYVDMDSAIRQIVTQYYKSKGEKNPFEIDVELEVKEIQSTTPREAVILEEGKLKGKGAPKSGIKEDKSEPKSKIKVEQEEPKLSEETKEWVENLEGYIDLINEKDSVATYGQKIVDEWREAALGYISLLKDFGLSDKKAKEYLSKLK